MREIQQDIPANHVRVSNTKFCIIINQTKIGTQYVRTFNHEEKKEYEPDTEFNVTLQFNKDNSSKWKIETGGDITEKHHLEDYDALHNFLNGTTTKDTIILIRNPYERFISAFNQDFIKPLFDFNNDSFYFLGLSSLNHKKHEQLYTWWMNNRHLIKQCNIPNYEKNNKLDKNYLMALHTIIKEFIHNWFQSKFPLDYKHNNFYHTTIVSMLFNNQNKYKIFDIDEVDMNNIFGKYLVGNKSLGTPNKATYTKEIVSDIINDDEELKQYIMFHLNLEIMAYNSLKQIMKSKND